MGNKIPVMDLRSVVDSAVEANINIQVTEAAKQVVLDKVVEAQEIVNNGVIAVTGATAGEIAKLDEHVVGQKVLLTEYGTEIAESLSGIMGSNIEQYDANALARTNQYNDNSVVKQKAYNDNDALKLQQYNDNHIDRLEDLNYAYADRIVQILKTTRILGLVDEFRTTTSTHMCTFLSTADTNYIYYGNGTKLELGVDYTVYDSKTIELVVKTNPYDVVTQINTKLLRDMLLNEEVLFRDDIGAPNGVAGLDENGLVPAGQLPSYVDDVIEVNTYAELPAAGEGNKIYIVVVDENNGGDTSSYRWTGTVYAMVSNTLTAADIKALYESNPDTNAFTDAAKALLDETTALATVANTLPTAVNELYEHTTNDGSDHSFINQDVKTTATPKFAGVQLTGGTGNQGLLSWNATEATLDLVVGEETLQLGQEFWVNVRNSTGSTILNGTPVMLAGTLGNSGRVLVGPMNGTDAANTMKIIGVTTTDIAAGADGKATVLGAVRGIDTTGTAVSEVWADNDPLYVHPTMIGKFTKIRPTAAQVDMPIGEVLHAHTNGTIIVRVLPFNRNEISPAIVANYYDKPVIDQLLAAQNDASEIGVTPQGNLSANTVQSALVEIQEQLDTITVIEEW